MSIRSVNHGKESWEIMIQRLYQTMEDELTVLQQKVHLINKLKTLDRDRWMEIRHDITFITFARKYQKLREKDMISFWSRKICKTP